MSAHPSAQLTALGIALLALLASDGRASELRDYHAIEAPARATGEIRPVPRELVEAGVRRLVAGWNTAGFPALVSERADDKQRLLAALDAHVPSAAKLRLLSLEDIRTVRQYRRRAADGARVQVSEVAVDMVTQVELERPEAEGRLQRHRGSLSVLVEVVRPIAAGGSGVRP